MYSFKFVTGTFNRAKYESKVLPILAVKNKKTKKPQR